MELTICKLLIPSHSFEYPFLHSNLRCFAGFICQLLLGILSYLKAICSFFCRRKCETIIILQIILLFLRVAQAISIETASRASFCLIVLGLCIGCCSCADLNRPRPQFRRAQRPRRNPYALDDALNNTLRGMIISHIRLNQIRQVLDILNQQRDGQDLENPGPRNNPFRIRFMLGAENGLELGDLHFLDGLILSNHLMRNAQPESSGLSKESIEQLMPAHQYQADETLEIIEHKGVGQEEEESKQGAEEDDQKNCCTICLEEFKTGQEVRVSPCSHTFHIGCIDAWLSIRNVCPNCKQEIGQADNPGSAHNFGGIELFANQMQNILRVEANMSQPRSIPEGDNASVMSNPSDDNSD